MADENRTILALVAIALVITVIGTVVSVSKLDGLGGQYTSLTGAAVDTGTTTVTIAGTASIALDDSTVDFGSGYVTEGSAYATLDSTTGPGSWTGWTNTSASSSGYMVLNNTGSVPLSVTVASANQANAETWLCKAGGCTSSTAALDVKATNAIEAGSCTTNGAIQSAYTSLLANQGNTTVTLCSEWDYNSGSDSLEVYFKAIVPNDASTGAARSLTVTFTGTDASA